jgi:hypothetical protein
MHRFSIVTISLSLCVAAGCSTKSAGPSSPTSTSITGTIQGIPVVADNTAGIFGTDSVSGSPIAGFLVMTAGITCSLLQAGGTAPPSSSALYVEVFNNGSKTPVPPGTYSLGFNASSPFLATGEFVANNSQCTEIVSQQLGGQITIDEASATAVAGSFDVITSAGEHVKGDFYAPVCDFDLHKLGTTGKCVPVDGG